MPDVEVESSVVEVSFPQSVTINQTGPEVDPDRLLPAESGSPGEVLTAGAEGVGWAAPAGGAASAVSVDSAGFDGNLAPSDDTVQKVAVKVDALVLGGVLPQQWRPVSVVADNETITTLAVGDDGLLVHNLLVVEPSLTSERAFINLGDPAAAVGQEVAVVAAPSFDLRYSVPGPELYYPSRVPAFLTGMLSAPPIASHDFSGANAQTVVFRIDGVERSWVLDEDLSDGGMGQLFFMALLTFFAEWGVRFAQEAMVIQLDETAAYAFVTELRGQDAEIVVVDPGTGDLGAALSSLTSVPGQDDFLAGPSASEFGPGDVGGLDNTHAWSDERSGFPHKVARVVSDGTDWLWLHRKMRPEELAINTLGDPSDWDRSMEPVNEWDVMGALNELAARVRAIETSG